MTPVALEHRRGAPAARARRSRAVPAGQPRELRVRVRQRCARLVAFVDEREADAADVARAPLPCLATRSSVASARSPNECTCAGPWIDDLLALERRVEVRHDAHAPAGRPIAEPQRLGRRPVLVACAERARRGIVARRCRCARPLGPRRRDRRPSDRSSGRAGGRPLAAACRRRPVRTAGENAVARVSAQLTEYAATQPSSAVPEPAAAAG